MTEETKLTFENFDKLGRGDFAARLTKAIQTFYPYHEGAYVLGLNAPYGTGKTTFLEMWKSELENEKYKVVNINAWETDFDDEPIIPIANALIEQLGNDGKGEKLKRAAKAFTGAFALTLNSIVAHSIGVNIDEVGKRVESDLDEKTVEKIGQEISSSFAQKKDMYAKLREALEEYVETLDGKPLIILVDELDRVRPNYAVEFLEAIKHIFSVQGICFVLAVDRQQLEVSVKQLYGDIDFKNYYLRFMTRETDLPEPKTENWDSFLSHMMVEYFDEKKLKGIQFPFEGRQKHIIQEHAKVLIKLFNFSLRQTQHLFRSYSQFIAIENSNKADKNRLIASLTLIAFSMGGKAEKQLYQSLGKGLLSPKGLINYLEGKSGLESEKKERRYEVFILNTLSFMMNSDMGEYYNQAISVFADSEINTWSLTRADIQTRIDDYYDGYGFDDASGFEQIYQKLQTWEDLI